MPYTVQLYLMPVIGTPFPLMFGLRDSAKNKWLKMGRYWNGWQGAPKAPIRSDL